MNIIYFLNKHLKFLKIYDIIYHRIAADVFGLSLRESDKSGSLLICKNIYDLISH